MADTRLPDVVPAKDLATTKEIPSNVLSVGTDSVVDIAVNPSDNQVDPPILQIWSDSDSPDSPLHLLEDVSSLRQDRRSTSQLSDSGIDSQLASPTVSDGYNKLHEQAFVLDLSATHLSVPSRIKQDPSLQSCLYTKQKLPKENVSCDNTADEEKIDPASITEFLSPQTSSRHQQQQHQNLVDHGSTDGWQTRSDNFQQEMHSLVPSESEQQMETDDAHLASSWYDSTSVTKLGGRNHQQQTSPQIYVQCRSLDQQSVISERSIRSDDSDESSHFLADQETDGGSYPSSRKPSFSSIRSENDTENSGSGRRPAFVNKVLPSDMLPVRSSSRSPFLSVPSRVPNSLWPSSERQSSNKQPESSLQSQTGSMSSLMASRLSLSNPYLRLKLAEGGINDALLATMSGEEASRYVVDIYDEPYYDGDATAAAAQLSLTQRLAFPELAASDSEISKPQQRNEIPRDESSLNFFAKIITFLVLVFVIVLVVGVLVKISHTPR